jgi:spore protease
MNPIRTDLAVEIYGELLRNNSLSDGIECTTKNCGSLSVEEVKILNEEGEMLSGKPKGRYLTVSTGKIWLDDREKLKEKVRDFCSVLRPWLKNFTYRKTSVLVAGLGNEAITADAIGPQTVKNLLVTRHIRSEKPYIFENLGLSDVCAITPGVLGQTGIESADIIKSVVKKIKPDLLIVIDALASRELSRLVNTVQLTDSGIRPGSGIGNRRPGLIPDEMGLPIISIGVPTVVDAATLAADAIDAFSGKAADESAIRRRWEEHDLNFFVTPKETDQIIRVMASFIGYALNLTFNETLSFEDMLSLTGG